jgi:predicted O-linked N-acetylglucosamine transferase (SPINDLY family)
MNWHPETVALLEAGHYTETAEFYEKQLEIEPDNITHYWYLGLSYLLQKKEDEAQLTWSLALTNLPLESEFELLVQNLISVLSNEAERQKENLDLEMCWLIRRHILSITDQNFDNILELILLDLENKTYKPEQILELNLVEVLKSQDLNLINQDKFLDILKKILEIPSPESLLLAREMGEILDSAAWEKIMNDAARAAGYFYQKFEHSVDLLEIVLNKYPQSLTSLENYSRFLCKACRYTEAVEVAEKLYDMTDNMKISYRYSANSNILSALMWSSDWHKLPIILERHKSFINQFLSEQSDSLSLGTIQSLIVKTSLIQYIDDNPQANRTLANDVGQLFCKNIYTHNSFPIPMHATFPSKRPQKLKIGYLSHTLREHSVGWLCRWLMKYHDHEKFEINAYLLGQAKKDAFFDKFLADHFDNVVMYENQVKKMAEQISQDQVHILIDLDSATLDYPCTLLSLKPAPIQATWLGYDASGIPTVDYYIADPYVLPENAQEYYQEKIWRLPQTYIAVDGFEMDVPTQKRENLGIPTDSVVFLTAQTGLKRNPEAVKMQLQIIQKVPNSYLLIKGLGAQDTLRSFFLEIANQIGVDPQQLIFLPMDKTSFTHRANLQVADVVLDTYPYNGATTTLETLWAGVPIVTLRGQQFAARNTYAFLTQVGVTEGIAATPDEYVEWGVRFGQDESLRQLVSMKLRESRNTSPLWNAKQFTQDMENAYDAMWQIYVDSLAS